MTSKTEYGKMRLREKKRMHSRGIEYKRRLDTTWRELHEYHADKPEGCSVDHIIPLKHPLVSGLHVPSNFQYLEVKENRKKSNKFDGTYENNSWKKE